jgi:hypothetical protein
MFGERLEGQRLEGPGGGVRQAHKKQAGAPDDHAPAVREGRKVVEPLKAPLPATETGSNGRRQNVKAMPTVPRQKFQLSIEPQPVVPPISSVPLAPMPML